MRRGDRGSATVMVVAFAGVLLLVGCALGVVASMVHRHRIAQSAADLSALAGAVEARGGGDPCGVADRVARANHAALVACRLVGSEVSVEVRVRGPRWLGQPHDLHARARAGPA